MGQPRPPVSPGGAAIAAVLSVAVAGCNAIFGVDDLSFDRDSAASGAGPGGSTTTSTGGDGAAGGGAGTGGGGASAGGGGGAPVTCSGSHEYVAVVADCIDVTDPDPDLCEGSAGQGRMEITTAHWYLGTARHAFVRFDIDPQVAQSPLASATLRLMVPGGSYTGGPESGEVWRVTPFARSDLFQSEPANVGASPLADSLGPVSQDQVVDWELPPGDIIDGESVFLGVRPVDRDNVNYWNMSGSVPPLLILTCL